MAASLLSKLLRDLEAKLSPTLSLLYLELAAEILTFWGMVASFLWSHLSLSPKMSRHQRDRRSKISGKKMHRVDGYYKKKEKKEYKGKIPCRRLA